MTSSQVAIKIINKKRLKEIDLERAHRETEIMLKLSHKHVVKLHHVIETDDKIFLVMDLVTGIDLMKYVIQKGGLSEEAAKSIFVQLLSALRYCHYMKVKSL
jgi:serine/threonine protein kinase